MILAFAGQTYYPCGGWLDYLGTFESVDEAKAAVAAGYDVTYAGGIVKHHVHDWAHLVDVGTRELLVELCNISHPQQQAADGTWLPIEREWVEGDPWA